MNTVDFEYVTYRLRRSIYTLHHVPQQFENNSFIELSEAMGENMPSAAQLIKHLRLNLGMWVLGPSGKIKPVKRNRIDLHIPSDWKTEYPLLEESVDSVLKLVRELNDEDWSETIRLSTIRCKRGLAILNSVTHFEGHTMQIVTMAKLQLGSLWIADPSHVTDSLGGW